MVCQKVANAKKGSRTITYADDGTLMVVQERLQEVNVSEEILYKAFTEDSKV